MVRNPLICLLLASAAVPAFSAEGVDSVHFIEGWRGDDGKHYAAIHIDLKEGWKTYWRSPQGSGIPPVLAVRRGGDIVDVEMVFPKPNLYEEFGEEVLGYTDSVTFPIVFNIGNATQPAQLNSQLSFAVCSDVCIPLNFSIETILSADVQTGVSAVKTALKSGPTKASKVGLKRHSCAIKPNGKTFNISADFNWPFVQDPQKVVVEYPNDAFWVQPVDAVRNGSTLSIQTAIKDYGAGATIIERNAIKTSVLTEDYIFEFAGC